MSRLGRRPALKLLALVIAASVIACAAIEALERHAATRDELAEARALWSRHAPLHYRLVVDEETTAGSCRQDLQVEDEHITAVRLNRCVRVPNWTVTNLFTWAADLKNGASRCYPTDVTCVCHITYTARTTFDPTLGYPQRITYHWALATNWAYWGHWERLARTHELPSCDQVARRADGYITITVVLLAPLP
jgi:hypothetical protein